jgi:threonine/homoserine efflux transporter RhtA
MSPNIPILALVLYPFLYVLPLNLVRFQWGFKKGLAPMPPEMEERAEAADRLVRFVSHAILLAVVVLLMHGSPISEYEVGLTADNWKSALGMGVLLSLFPLGLSELVLRNLPPEEFRKELESRGPVAAWCGLTTLGSFSHELWRAFCIVALIRLGLSA